MVHDHDFSPSVYVPRDSLEQSLRRALIAPTSPTYRNFILEGPARSGKTWLIRRLQAALEQEAHVIVLPVSLETFTPGYRQEPEEVFLPLLATLKTIAKTKYPELDISAISQHVDVNDLQSDLEQLSMQIARLATAPLVVIIVDGMEEIIEHSQRLQANDPRLEHEDLLYRLEANFISPLFRYNYVRLLGSRRAQPGAWWKTLPIRKHITSTNCILDSPLSLQEQYAKLAHTAGTQGDLPALPLIQADLPYYGWNNVGANAMLITHAFDYGLPLSRDSIADCLTELLRSPIGDPLPANKRQQLDTIIKAHYSSVDNPADQPLPRVCINDYLQINDNQRIDFINVMTKHGIGRVKTLYFEINPEIITLSRELHARGQR